MVEKEKNDWVDFFAYCDKHTPVSCTRGAHRPLPLFAAVPGAPQEAEAEAGEVVSGRSGKQGGDMH